MKSHTQLFIKSLYDIARSSTAVRRPTVNSKRVCFREPEPRAEKGGARTTTEEMELKVWGSGIASVVARGVNLHPKRFGNLHYRALALLGGRPHRAGYVLLRLKCFV